MLRFLFLTHQADVETFRETLAAVRQELTDHVEEAELTRRKLEREKMGLENELTKALQELEKVCGMLYCTQFARSGGS